MLSVIMLSVIMLSVIILSVIMLSVIMLSVIMLTDVAPKIDPKLFLQKSRSSFWLEIKGLLVILRSLYHLLYILYEDFPTLNAVFKPSKRVQVGK